MLRIDRDDEGPSAHPRLISGEGEVPSITIGRQAHPLAPKSEPNP